MGPAGGDQDLRSQPLGPSTRDRPQPLSQTQVLPAAPGSSPQEMVLPQIPSPTRKHCAYLGAHRAGQGADCQHPQLRWVSPHTCPHWGPLSTQPGWNGLPCCLHSEGRKEPENPILGPWDSPPRHATATAKWSRGAVGQLRAPTPPREPPAPKWCPRTRFVQGLWGVSGTREPFDSTPVCGREEKRSPHMPWRPLPPAPARRRGRPSRAHTYPGAPVRRRVQRGASGRLTWTTRPPCATRRRRS